VQVRIDDSPAQIEPLSAQRWRIALRPQGLPQRIEVFYQGELDDSSERALLAVAPTVENIAVQRTLWTIYAPPSAGQSKSKPSGQVSQLQLDTLRLRSLTELLRLPRHQRVESAPRETHDWLVAWETRWQTLRAEIARSQRATHDDDPVVADLIDIDAEHRRAIDQLDGATLPRQSAARGEHAFSKLSVGPHPVVARAIVQGSSSTLRVQFAPTAAASERQSRWLIAVVMAMGAVALGLSRWWLPSSDWPLRCARAIGVALGLAWILWLWPAWVGWVIVVWCLLPRNWPGRRESLGDTGSAVILRGAAQS
jgi:hypothetical protein